MFGNRFIGLLNMIAFPRCVDFWVSEGVTVLGGRDERKLSIVLPDGRAVGGMGEKGKGFRITN